MAKKDKKEDVKKQQPKKPSFSLGKVCFVFGVLSVLSGVLAYYIYYQLTTPPPLPQMDLQAWWGQFPISQDPDLSIRPFKIEFSDEIVNDLRERLLHRRPFVPPLEGAGFSYGFNSQFLTRVLDYWQNNYNFKDREQFLNQFNHYITNIQGLDIHYIHVKPKATDVKVVPLLLLHGWPGSVRQFYELAPRLTARRPGRNFVFELVIPSLPGFGFSQGASRPGLGPAEVAVVLHNLMQRVGLKQYYIQSGDALGSHMATLFPGHVRGLHTNFPVVGFSALAHVYTYFAKFWPGLVEEELQDRLYPWTEKISNLVKESGYLHIQATKPDTIGAALTDSPAGLAAYILEKFSTWTDPAFQQAGDGNLLAKFSLAHLLDNVMIYWVSNSITSSMRLSAETFSTKQLALKLDKIPTDVPTWGLKLKHELVSQPDCVLRLKFPHYLHSTVLAGGGHFAALESPDILADDVFDAVNTFQEFHAHRNPEDPGYSSPKTVYDFTVKDINGKDVKLEKYHGFVSIIVNVASQCGYTDNHYKELNELYDKYENEGLRILAFPCNQFGSQEPGSPQDILTFAKQKRVRFDLFEKVNVNGENAHPLWKFLKGAQSGTLSDAIKWNFSKFIVDRNGVPVERFGPSTSPMQMEAYLAKYW